MPTLEVGSRKHIYKKRVLLYVLVFTRTKGARAGPTSRVRAHTPTDEGAEKQEKLCWRCPAALVVVVAPATRSSCWT